jgi:hypothetical protein
VNGRIEPNEGGKEDVILAVETVHMNVLYVGVDNPVIIAANGIDLQNIEVTTDNGNLRREGDRFIISPARVGNVYVEILKDGVKIGSKDFRAQNLQAPQAFLIRSGMKFGSGEVRLADLVNAAEMKAEIPDFLLDVDFKIIGFQIKIERKGIIIVAISENETLSASQRDLLKTLGPGQTVIIEEIRAVGPDGLSRLLEPLVFEII